LQTTQSSDLRICVPTEFGIEICPPLKIAQPRQLQNGPRNE
jgi:hypothetical protein